MGLAPLSVVAGIIAFTIAGIIAGIIACVTARGVPGQVDTVFETKPVGPSGTDVGRNDEIVPHREQFVGVDELPNVFFAAFPQDDFIHVPPLLEVGKIVRPRTAPFEVQRQCYDRIALFLRRLRHVITPFAPVHRLPSANPLYCTTHGFRCDFDESAGAVAGVLPTSRKTPPEVPRGGGMSRHDVFTTVRPKLGVDTKIRHRYNCSALVN